MFNDNAELSEAFKQSSSAKDETRIKIENQIWRENLIASLNSYINKNGKDDPNNNDNYAHYLLSYYDETIMSKDPVPVALEGVFNLFQILYSHE